MITLQTTLFAVLTPEPNENLAQSIATQFRENSLRVSPTHFFIATAGTAIELSNKLDITTGNIGSGIVLVVSSYYGRASVSIWDWISAKIGAPVSAP